MPQHPEQFGGRWVCRERQAAEVHQSVGALVGLELVDDAGAASVGPDDGVVQRFARLGIPYDGCFALVGDAHGFDIREGVALRGECFAGFVDAF